MLPRWAIVDPLLTHSMPPELTASTGLDALTQLIEAFVSNKANPLTDGVCREGLQRAGRSLRRAFENGATPMPARTCRWRASSAAWPWRTPSWARSTVSPDRWAA